MLGLEELFREDGDQRQAVIFGFPGGGHAVGLVSHRRDAAPFNPVVMGLDHLAFTVPTPPGAGSVGRAARPKGHRSTLASSTCRPVPS